MAAGNASSLDSRVRSYTKSWVSEVSQKLEAHKMKLMMSTPHERAGIKSSIETLSTVLEQLQGKKEIEIYCRGAEEMREEIIALKKKLEETRIKHRDSANMLHVSNKIIKDLKLQLEVARVKQMQSTVEVERSMKHLRQQLKHVQCSSAAILSVQTAINKDLTSKLEQAKKQLQQPCQSAADDPKLQLHKSKEKGEKQPCSVQEDEAAGPHVEEKLREVRRDTNLCAKQETQIKVMEKVHETDRSVQSLSTDTPVLELQEKAPEKKKEEESKPDLHDEEQKVVRFTISQLKTFFNNSAGEAWEVHEAERSKQRVEISKLTAAVRCANEQLEVQRQESARVLQQKEQKWAQSLKEANRRRHWFLRAFPSAS
ncbi:eukaryotic translation initiation factor 3 subunit A-like [Scomber scombrus]|uniref:Eukaryotic translation initiation factor 3 subunit A-like n=1 Tax=Scomber scombrus TaxID=13677 RepID=A0AAV1QA60_SCOSC